MLNELLEILGLGGVIGVVVATGVVLWALLSLFGRKKQTGPAATLATAAGPEEPSAAEREQQELLDLRIQTATLTADLQQAKSTLEQRDSTVADLQGRLTTSQSDTTALKEQVARLETEIGQAKTLRATLAETQEGFKKAAAEAMAEHQTKLLQANNESIGTTIKPFSEQIKTFKEQVERMNVETVKDRERMQESVKGLQEKTHALDEEAKELTQALKGKAQVRGNWGEMQLRRLLQMAGLESGRDFEEQTSYQNAEGGRIRPDFIIHLSDNKSLIVDSKVSLLSWTQLIEAQPNTPQAQAAGTAFAQETQRRIDELASKEYSDASTLDAGEFVLLYIPIQSASEYLWQHHPQLIERAQDKKVILSSPSTLLPILLTVATLRRRERAAAQTREISKAAQRFVDKIQTFLDHIDAAKKGQAKASDFLDRAQTSLTGRGGAKGIAEQIAGLSGARLPKGMTSEEDAGEVLITQPAPTALEDSTAAASAFEASPADSEAVSQSHFKGEL